MPTVREFFAREAGDFLDRLDRVVEGMDAGSVSPAELHRVSRALRGSAQMAREDGIAQVAAALEGLARALADGHVRWTPDLSGRVRDTLRDVRGLLKGESDGTRVKNAVARLAGVAAALSRGSPASRPAAVDAERQFREFAARETAAVLAAVESALQAIATNPTDREPLKAVLRRQRALMGAARLPSIPLLAEVLTAIDEITRMVARLDVTVKDEWLEGYRSARDVLGTLASALQRGTEPVLTSALARLRTVRQELNDRHGGEEPMRQPPVFTPEDAATMAASAAAAPAPSAPATTAGAGGAHPAAPATPPRAPAVPARPPVAEVHSIDEFLYRGERALGRAIELRPELERALVAGDARAHELLAELFDLIELARGAAAAAGPAGATT